MIPARGATPHVILAAAAFPAPVASGAGGSL